MRIYPHNQLGKLERLLQTTVGRVMIVTEAIFSMDGDACPLTDIVELKERYGAWLMLDEAHSVGVLGPQGRGLAAALGVEQRVELQMGTLSKALGLSGGYIAATRQVIDLLINRARSFIYSTAPPPALAHAAAVALQAVSGEEGDKLRAQLWRSVEQISRSLGHQSPAGGILPLIIGGEAEAMAASAKLREGGFIIPAIRYPTVARGRARLRLTVSAAHSGEHVQALLAVLRPLLETMPRQ